MQEATGFVVSNLQEIDGCFACELEGGAPQGLVVTEASAPDHHRRLGRGRAEFAVRERKRQPCCTGSPSTGIPSRSPETARCRPVDHRHLEAPEPRKEKCRDLLCDVGPVVGMNDGNINRKDPFEPYHDSADVGAGNPCRPHRKNRFSGIGRMEAPARADHVHRVEATDLDVRIPRRECGRDRIAGPGDDN